MSLSSYTCRTVIEFYDRSFSFSRSTPGNNCKWGLVCTKRKVYYGSGPILLPDIYSRVSLESKHATKKVKRHIKELQSLET